MRIVSCKEDAPLHVALSLVGMQVDSEFYTLSQEAADTLNSVKAAGGRIVAVGTTSIRTFL